MTTYTHIRYVYRKKPQGEESLRVRSLFPVTGSSALIRRCPVNTFTGSSASPAALIHHAGPRRCLHIRRVQCSRKEARKKPTTNLKQKRDTTTITMTTENSKRQQRPATPAKQQAEPNAAPKPNSPPKNKKKQSLKKQCVSLSTTLDLGPVVEVLPQIPRMPFNGTP